MRAVTRPNHWGMTTDLDSWLRDEGVPGVVGIDTRRLTIHLRSVGVLRGVVSVYPEGESPSSENLAGRIRAAPVYGEEDYVSEIAVPEPVLYDQGGPLVALLDCGVKASIVRALLDRHLSVLRLPPAVDVPEKVDGTRVSGLVVGNGPGDPATLRRTIECLADPRIRELPTLGICLGLQLLALSRGASTFKLKFGHRGQNKTVCFSDGRAVIVSENHGYAVDPKSLSETGFQSWAVNPDDATVEAIRDRRGRVLALQGHPEGHPGPQEAGFVFDEFAARVRRGAA